MLRAGVKLPHRCFDESLLRHSSVSAAEQTAHPSAVRAGGRCITTPVGAWHLGRTRRSAVRHESWLALAFYPSARAGRGPLRPSGLKPNAMAAVPSS